MENHLLLEDKNEKNCIYSWSNFTTNVFFQQLDSGR
jgi:hypothetical protein